MQSELKRREFIALLGGATAKRMFAGAAPAAFAAPAAIAASANAAEFYRGKTLRILVGSPPGGGYDIYARLVAPALAEKIGAEVHRREQGRQWRARRAGDVAGASGRRAYDHEWQRRGGDPQSDAGSAGRNLGRDQAELARQAGERAEAVVRRQDRALPHNRRRTQSKPSDLVGDRPGRRHQRRRGHHFLRARA